MPGEAKAKKKKKTHMAACIEKGFAEHVHVFTDGIRTSVPEPNVSSETNRDGVGGGGDFNE